MSTAPTILNGATSRIQAMFQGASLSDVPVSPAALDLPFQESEWNRNPVYTDNDTMNSGELDYAQELTDYAPSITLAAPYCLNSIGFFLKMLLGAPVTTGAGPTYTHVFTFNNCPLPTALFEALQRVPCDTGLDRERYLGVALNQMSWDPMAQKPTFACEFIAGRPVIPAPEADFDDTPTRLPMLMAVSRAAVIADVIGSSTLGQIAASQVTLNNRLEGIPLADGNPGNGQIIRANKPLLSGSLTALWETGTLYDHARSRVSKALKIVAKDASGAYSMTTSLPKVKFAESPKPLNVRGGIRTQHAWTAHYEDGDAAPTVTLVNTTATY